MKEQENGSGNGRVNVNCVNCTADVRDTADVRNTMDAKEQIARVVNVLGIPFDAVTPEEAVGKITNVLTETGDRLFAVVTPNPTMVMEAGRNPRLAEAIKEADLRLADGVGILGAARRAGTPLPGRVTGVDTGFAVLREAAKLQIPVFLLGGRPGVAERAAARLEEMMPGIRIVGTENGYFEDADSERVIGKITAAGTKLLIVCLGSPRQEIWVREHAGKLTGTAAAMTLGGALDVWAGKTRRAPRIFQKLCIEWLWRMFSQPGRFAFLPDMIRFRMRTGKRRKKC